MVFRMQKVVHAPRGGACVCGVAEYPATNRYSSAGGSPAVTTGDPTKRVVTCADIWPDQPEPPLLFGSLLK